jgi:hypothetical protein
MTSRKLNVLVVGGTGGIGSPVVEEAMRQGHAVRALVRNASKARQLPREIKTVIGDLTRPETLSAAVEGIDAIVFTHGSDGGGKAGSELVDYGGVMHLHQDCHTKSLRHRLRVYIHRERLSERREPMKFKSLLLVLMFALTSAAWPQAAPSQTPASASGSTPSAQHQQMMEMHKQQMEGMKADVEKMKSSLAQMKANLLTIKDTNEMARWRNNVDMWETMVGQMEQMQKHMDSMIGMGGSPSPPPAEKKP